MTARPSTRTRLTPEPTDEELDQLLAACGLTPPPACGTYAAYARHIRRHETPCEPCREANRQAGRRLAQADHTRLRPIPHGTTAGARAHQYRREAACGECAKAYRAYHRGRYAARNRTTHN